MLRRALRVAIFLCLLPCAAAFGADARSELSRWMSAQEDVRIVEGRFLQQRTTPLLSAPLVSAGTFRIERPDRMRWAVENPEALVLEMEGNRIRGGRPGNLRDIPATEAMTGLREMTEIFFGGNKEAIEQFRVAAGDAQGSFVLTPRASATGSQLSQIVMVLGGADGGLSEIILQSRSGDRSEIRFLDVVLHRAGSEKSP